MKFGQFAIAVAAIGMMAGTVAPAEAGSRDRECLFRC